MRGSKLPFRIWLGAIYLYVIDQNVTATEMQEKLGHGTYSSMWELLEKIKTFDPEMPELQERYKREKDTNLIPNYLFDLSMLDFLDSFIFREPVEAQDSIWNWLIGF